MADVFISYAREDQDRAEDLARALIDSGWSVWWDAQLYVGKPFAAGILQALQRSKCVVVLWSKSSLQSEWVRREADLGNERGVLVPVLLERDIRPPKPYADLHASRLHSWTGSTRNPAFSTLSEAIAGLAGPGRPLANGPIVEERVRGIPRIESISAGFGSMWLESSEGELLRYDPVSDSIQARIDTGPTDLCVVGAHWLWLLTKRGLLKVDPKTNSAIHLATLHQGGTDGIRLTESLVWVMALPQWLTPLLYVLPAEAEGPLLLDFSLEIDPSFGPETLPGDRLIVGSFEQNELLILSGPNLDVEAAISARTPTATLAGGSIWFKPVDDRNNGVRRFDLETLTEEPTDLPSTDIYAEVEDYLFISGTGSTSNTTPLVRYALRTSELSEVEGLADPTSYPKLGKGSWGRQLPWGSPCAANGYLWVPTGPRPALLKIDIELSRVVAEFHLDAIGPWTTYHEGAVWAVEDGGGTFTRIDPESGLRTWSTTFAAPYRSGRYIFGRDSVWFFKTKDELWRIRRG